MIDSKPKTRRQLILLTLYYLAILLVLVWMEMNGSFELPKFVYQGF